MESLTSRSTVALLTANPMASFDRLPSELKIMVLMEMPDIKSLLATIHASSEYRAVFSVYWKSILPSFFDNDMLIDAIMVKKSSELELEWTTDSSTAKQLLDEYDEARKEGVCSFPKGFSPDDALEIISFRSQVEDTANDLFTMKPSLIALSIARGSWVEKKIMIRALYRIQLFMNTFRLPEMSISFEDGSSQPFHIYYEHKQKYLDSLRILKRYFFDRYHPWEGGDMVSIMKYITGCCEQLAKMLFKDSQQPMISILLRGLGVSLFTKIRHAQSERALRYDLISSMNLPPDVEHILYPDFELGPPKTSFRTSLTRAHYNKGGSNDPYRKLLERMDQDPVNLENDQRLNADGTGLLEKLQVIQEFPPLFIRSNRRRVLVRRRNVHAL
ncbi:MAG: hypothetical protein M1834_002045 [Cirrosporium novae-zelandiae]|nr:MAG: hypothetical protein M1834_002045 [Cirrosporium novae-zelandiae]